LYDFEPSCIGFIDLPIQSSGWTEPADRGFRRWGFGCLLETGRESCLPVCLSSTLHIPTYGAG